MSMGPCPEDLPGADRVQFLHVIEEQDADTLHAGHSLRVGARDGSATVEWRHRRVSHGGDSLDRIVRCRSFGCGDGHALGVRS
jgi:hypothetical protein